MPAVRKPASTETAVQSRGRVGVDSVLRADPPALPAHTEVSLTRGREVNRGASRDSREELCRSAVSPPLSNVS
jgi:hypothetical protein